MICVDKHNLGYHIASAAGVVYNPAADHCIARVENGRLVGGCVFQEFTGSSIRIHMAGFTRRWINKQLAFMCFAYPFNQLGCDKLIATCRSSNTSALEIIHRLGFSEEARITWAFLDGDMVILTMLRPQCRWLNLKPTILKGQTNGL